MFVTVLQSVLIALFYPILIVDIETFPFQCNRSFIVVCIDEFTLTKLFTLKSIEEVELIVDAI